MQWLYHAIGAAPCAGAKISEALEEQLELCFSIPRAVRPCIDDAQESLLAHRTFLMDNVLQMSVQKKINVTKSWAVGSALLCWQLFVLVNLQLALRSNRCVPYQCFAGLVHGVDWSAQRQALDRRLHFRICTEESFVIFNGCRRQQIASFSLIPQSALVLRSFIYFL